MLKSQLALNVAGRLLQIRRRDVEKAIDAVLDEIVAALARKDRVELRGFGRRSLQKFVRVALGVIRKLRLRSWWMRRGYLFAVRAKKCTSGSIPSLPYWTFQSSNPLFL